MTEIAANENRSTRFTFALPAAGLVFFCCIMHSAEGPSCEVSEESENCCFKVTAAARELAPPAFRRSASI